ncbi:MAG: hypothetical protein MUC63_03510 [Planctomycetes bacterium]|nr:hypothetical protein [Planctomycetota bacterium]
MLLSRSFAALLPILALGVSAPAEEPAAPFGDFEAELRRLSGELNARHILKRIEPDEAQAKALLPVAVEARSLRERFEKDRAECRSDLEKALAAMKARAANGDEPGGEAASAAERARGRLRDLEASFLRDLGALGKRVEAVLSKEQREAALAYRSPIRDQGKDGPGSLSEGPGGPKEPSREEKLLREVRGAPEGGFERIEGLLVKLQLEREEARRGEPYAEKARKAREAEVRLLFARARALPGEDFEAAAKGMAAELEPRTMIEDLEWKLRGLDRGGEPALTAIEKYLLSPWAADVIARRIEQAEKKRG